MNILFVADSGTGKSSIITAIVREYYKDYYQEIVSLNLAKKQQILREYIKMFFFMVIYAIILFL